jgi:pilus assembly protein CpaB
MRFVFGLVLLLGLGLAGSAVYLVQGYLDRNESELRRLQSEQAQRVDVTEIYVAAVPLKYGDRLTPDLVRLTRYPTASLPEGTFTDEAVLFAGGTAQQRTVLRAIEANEPLLAVKVSEPGQDAGLTTMLSPGMRAFTLSVNAQSGVSGFVHPGDRVDIFWTGKVQGTENTLRLDTNVRVVAVDQSFDQDTRETRVAKTVTVEGTAQQVANFQQAQAAGDLSLALLGAGDMTDTDVQNVDINRVLGIEVAAPEAVQEVEEERQCFITVRQGVEDVQKQIRCPEQP